MENLINPPAIRGEQVAGRSATVRDRLRVLSLSINKNTFDFIELLVEAKSNRYLAQWGYRSVVEFGEKELGIKERRIQYLCRIGEVCRQVGLTRDMYEPAGVSKLREICTLKPKGFWLNPETKENESLENKIIDLITDAPDLSHEEITEQVLILKGMVGGNRPVVRSFSWTADTWELVIKKAIEMARKRLGSSGRDEDGLGTEYSDAVCIEAIVAEWTAGEERDQEVENLKIPTEDPSAI